MAASAAADISAASGSGALHGGALRSGALADGVSGAPVRREVTLADLQSVRAPLGVLVPFEVPGLVSLHLSTLASDPVQLHCFPCLGVVD